MTHPQHSELLEKIAMLAKKPLQNMNAVLLACLPLVGAAFLTGCGNIWTTQQAFIASKNPVSSLNGATIFPHLVPMGGEVKFGLNTMVYFAGVEQAAAPYAIYVIAHGTPGVHESLVIDDLKLHTSYNKTEPLPDDMLGKSIPFTKTTDPAIAQATFGCNVVWHPGQWDQVGPVNVEITATVIANGTSQTHTFTHQLDPTIRKEKQFESIGGDFLRVIRGKEKLVDNR
jgi:hypothetical protein